MRCCIDQSALCMLMVMSLHSLVATRDHETEDDVISALIEI